MRSRVYETKTRLQYGYRAHRKCAYEKQKKSVRFRLTTFGSKNIDSEHCITYSDCMLQENKTEKGQTKQKIKKYLRNRGKQAVTKSGFGRKLHHPSWHSKYYRFHAAIQCAVNISKTNWNKNCNMVKRFQTPVAINKCCVVNVRTKGTRDRFIYEFLLNCSMETVSERVRMRVGDGKCASKRGTCAMKWHKLISEHNRLAFCIFYWIIASFAEHFCMASHLPRVGEWLMSTSAMSKINIISQIGFFFKTETQQKHQQLSNSSSPDKGVPRLLNCLCRWRVIELGMCMCVCVAQQVTFYKSTRMHQFKTWQALL